MARSSDSPFSHRLGSIYVTPETASRLDRVAVQQGKSINELIRDALDAHLRRLDKRGRVAA